MNAQNYSNKITQKSSLNKNEINLIICYVLNISLAEFYIYEKEINSVQRKKIKSYVNKREGGLPFEYISNCKQFWTLDLYVDDTVLIPRPETEKIIEIFKKLTPKSFNGNILDMGTGSGVIAISVAKERCNANITAIDCSEKSLKVAKKNALKNGVNTIVFLQSDWFSNITSKYDFIISNPPYIQEDDPHLQDLMHEPINALVSGKTGLEDLENIIINAKNYLNKNGKLMLEHGYNQKNDLHKLLTANGYVNIETFNDLANIPRITVAAYL